MIKHLTRALAKIQGLFSNSRVEEELAKEIATHLQYLEDEFLRQGLSPLEAHRQARLACGGVEQVQQASDVVKQAILGPVKQVDGIMHGIRAAISVVAHSRRESVDHATQDEEMFI